MIDPKPFEPDYAVHPGQTLLECILYQFAYEMLTKKPFIEWGGKLPEDDPLSHSDLPSQNIHEFAQELLAVIQERAPITEELVNKFPKGLPVKKFWLNYQANYDKDIARLAKK